MTEIERKAALALFPYFSKNPVVVDVGSNIGDWAAVLAPCVDLMVLFEPNEILRHYSQVRFRSLKNTIYHSTAVSDRVGTAEFSYFEDEHDGLSNIIGNPKWNYLNPKHDVIDTVSLDSLYGKHIDLLKIDVEGAELLVLKGAERLLREKRIKFIQVEHAEHINVTGKSFHDITWFMSNLDYRRFHFNGETFERMNYGDEDVNVENYYFMADPNFSENWNLEFIENTKGMKCDFVLEIGCFEGLTSRYICDNLLNKDGRMVCVDPLTDEYLPDHKDNAMFVGQYDRFIRNTKGYPIELRRLKFSDAYEDMYHYRFDLIYVDGDHREESVYWDAKRAFFLCRVGGFILFDDYDGYDEGTKRGIDRWLDELSPKKGEVVKRGYQLLFKKFENLN